MEVNDVITLISSVGFPIVAACGMFYLYDNTIKNITTTLNMTNQTLQDVKRSVDELSEHLRG